MNQCESVKLESISLEAVTRRCFVKEVFFEISQNSQENTCARASFSIKLQASGFIFKKTILLKNSLWHRCFPLNFVKFLGTPSYRTPPVADSVSLSFDFHSVCKLA